MGNNDVEMEDAEKQEHDMGNIIEESESKMLDVRIENKGKEFPSAVTIDGNAKESEHGGVDVNKLKNEANDQDTIDSKMEDQPSRDTETNKPTYVDRSTVEQNNTKSDSEGRSSTGTNAQEQTAARSTYKNQVVEQIATNGGLEEENSTEISVIGGNPVKNFMVENPKGDVEAEKAKGTEKEDGDCVSYAEMEEMSDENDENGSDPMGIRKIKTELSSVEAPQVQNDSLDEVPQNGNEEMKDASNANEDDEAVDDEPKQQLIGTCYARPVTDGNTKTIQGVIKREGDDSCFPYQHETATPNAPAIYSPASVGGSSGETAKTVFAQAILPLMGENDDGTPEDQATFMRELESFYREKAMDFKPPKFYGQPLNCLKLWRAVIKLGGYDRVTGSKLWRQVGESFHPPKTCTTVSWTFRIFYEKNIAAELQVAILPEAFGSYSKSLLEYERHKRQIGDLQLPVATLPEASGADSEANGYQGSGSGRARRDAAARAMQGWHVQRLFDNGEVGEPVIKDKNITNMAKREKNIKSIGSLKQKRPNEMEHSFKAARTETSRQLVTSVVDIGPPADWVKINVRQTKDCFEVYALVPGLLREEVRVQSDPAGRLVITGQPEQADNPWGITPFKKVVSLPARIDPLHTSAVVSLHGRLFVRVPFELV